MPYLKRINSLPLINHISYKYTQVSDIGPSWSSCYFYVPNNEIVDLSIFKAVAHDIVNLAEILVFIFAWVQNNIGNGGNTGYQQFITIPQCFQMLSLSGL